MEKYLPAIELFCLNTVYDILPCRENRGEIADISNDISNDNRTIHGTIYRDLSAIFREKTGDSIAKKSAALHVCRLKNFSLSETCQILGDLAVL
jgi:hypothetical protein